MIKSIWEKIKLAFERKPAGEIYKVNIEVPTLPTIVVKPKSVRKPKNEST